MALADTRLIKVFDKFTERISQKQTLSMRKLSIIRSEEIQFGRFVGNKRVDTESLKRHLYEQMKNSCTSCSSVLLIEDSSQMSFSLNRKIEGLGKVDKGQVKGFYIHPVLCMDAYNGACHGIASIDFFEREFEQEKRTRKEVNAERSKTAFEHKEGYRWYGSIESALKNLSGSVRKTVIADRESDIFPVLTRLSIRLKNRLCNQGQNQ